MEIVFNGNIWVLKINSRIFEWLGSNPCCFDQDCRAPLKFPFYYCPGEPMGDWREKLFCNKCERTAGGRVDTNKEISLSDHEKYCRSQANSDGHLHRPINKIIVYKYGTNEKDIEATEEINKNLKGG